ncbi:hypothetical protein PR202_gb26095 [Eleusine coracana subsp. coracana]|uniref:Uncharacterized protein n=1 Tax=Eleusine coracana subsp. coracana TaxID=191504 RepID=A0AAV5FNC8_ELECO|nr:hypothetical protein PR202_gb26095 [Eleusine coracana subsp. coracana]
MAPARSAGAEARPRGARAARWRRQDRAASGSGGREEEERADGTGMGHGMRGDGVARVRRPESVSGDSTATCGCGNRCS